MSRRIHPGPSARPSIVTYPAAIIVTTTTTITTASTFQVQPWKSRPTTMDRLSRFRRSKKATTPRSPAGSPTPSNPDNHTSAPPTRTESPPILSITTTPSTTPPGSSHSNPNSSHSSLYPPKSPFRGFHFRNSHKRARSPAPASLPVPTSPAVVKHDGTVEPEIATSVNGHEKETDESVMEKPKIPSFLTLSEQDIEFKFRELHSQERVRLQQSAQNPSPSFQFARITAPEAKLLDRYMNIHPWANNRVKLQVPEGHLDYINASPIVLESPLKPKERPPHRYIAMQGPKEITRDHVWRMVTEQLQSPAVIVMLTDIYEGVYEKCFPYFPQEVEQEPWEINEIDEFGDGFRATIRCESYEEKADGAIEIRKLLIQVDGREEEMTVWHLFYRRWADFSIPRLEDIDSFLELMRLSREKNASEDNPRIIHCSAGVGRSGTFMALEHLMREIDSGDLERYDEQHDGDSGAGGVDLVYQTVNALREQRKLMVQAEVQYLLIYQVLRKQWMEKYGLTEEECDPAEEPAAKRLEVDHDPFIENRVKLTRDS
ncbi:phosphatases II [Xylariomycetidae sp. FL2044]|nr:phosphatases II [Xylariomycetidae sp. FL2044]